MLTSDLPRCLRARSSVRSPKLFWRSRAQPLLQWSGVSLLVFLKNYVLACKSLNRNIRETDLKAVVLSQATTFIFRHYIHCLCVVIWSFPTGVFLFFKKIIDLLFTISYTCNIVFPPSKLSTIGEVSTFLNKMLANINGRNRSFCKSNSFICGLS